MTVWHLSGTATDGSPLDVYTITRSDDDLPDYRAALEKASPGAEWAAGPNVRPDGQLPDAWLDDGSNIQGNTVRFLGSRWRAINLGLVADPTLAD